MVVIVYAVSRAFCCWRCCAPLYWEHNPLRCQNPIHGICIICLLLRNINGWTSLGLSIRLKYEGEIYHGKATSVFAYYASPITVGMETDQEKYPAVVLVHGGGGKAFSEWALLWAKRGYVAIAMDLAGRGLEAKRLVDGGPDQSHDAKFQRSTTRLRINGHTMRWRTSYAGIPLLRRLDEVDVSKTAVTGISWGGYLTCIVAGLDDRFQVAMPVYGCGFLKDNSAWTKSEFAKMTPPQVAKWHKLWDPSVYIGSAKMR